MVCASQSTTILSNSGYVSSGGSGETAWMLPRAFTACLCDKCQILECWLIYFNNTDNFVKYQDPTNKELDNGSFHASDHIRSI